MRAFTQKQEQPQRRPSLNLTRPSASAFAASHQKTHPILHLQRTIGNQAVQRLLHANAEGLEAGVDPTVSTRFGYAFSRIPVYDRPLAKIQPKLTVNTPGDIYEQEADRVANQVMRMPEPRLQRACACGGGCPKCRSQTEQLGKKKGHLQTKRVREHDSGDNVAPPIVQGVIRSPGQPLDPATRDFMESRFGHDFSQVRVHTNAETVESTRAVNAQVYTVGRDVAFGEGQYAPQTFQGRQLLAHELAHVIQQNHRRETANENLKVSNQSLELSIVKKDSLQMFPEEYCHSRYMPCAPQIAEKIKSLIGAKDPIAGPSRSYEAIPILAKMTVAELLEVFENLEGNHLKELITQSLQVATSTETILLALAIVFLSKGNSFSIISGWTEFEEDWNDIEADTQNKLDTYYINKTGNSFRQELLKIQVESTAQPQLSQSWGDRVRAAQQLQHYDKKAINAYVALIVDALGIGSDEVHVAKSREDYRPGVINFDMQLQETGLTVGGRPPLRRRDPLPEESKVVIGPMAISESSPIHTQATVLHERTHESHFGLLLDLAKTWEKSNHPYFEEWFERIGRKAISEENYHLIKERFSGTDPQHSGITEILSNLVAFTAHYHVASEEEVKKRLLEHNLASMAYEIGALRGEAKPYYQEMVRRRLLAYYRALDKGHRSTFDSMLDYLASITTFSEGQKRVYYGWAEFRRKFP